VRSHSIGATVSATSTVTTCSRSDFDLQPTEANNKNAININDEEDFMQTIYPILSVL
jgi:hypothetical protein